MLLSTATEQASDGDDKSDSAEAESAPCGLYPGPTGPDQKLPREKKDDDEEGEGVPLSDSAVAGFEEPQPLGQPSLPHGHVTANGDGDGEAAGAEAGAGVEAGVGEAGVAAGTFVPGGASVGRGSATGGAETGEIAEDVAFPPLPCGAPLTDPPNVGGSVPGPSNLAVPGTRGTSGL